MIGYGCRTARLVKSVTLWRTKKERRKKFIYVYANYCCKMQKHIEWRLKFQLS